MRGAISAEVNEAVSQRTAQHSAFAQSLHAETVVAENSEKVISEQRDKILAESHSMQDTTNGLNDTFERLRSDLEKVQREMARKDPQPASSFQNVSSESCFDKKGNIFDPRLFPTQMLRLPDLCLRLFHSRVGQTPFLVQCSLISIRMRDGFRSRNAAEIRRASRQISRTLNGCLVPRPLRRSSVRPSLALSGTSMIGPKQRKLILQLLRLIEPGKRLLAKRFGLHLIGLMLHSPG